MMRMFYGCTNFTSITFGQNFKCQNVNFMGAMFAFCTSLETLDLIAFANASTSAYQQAIDSNNLSAKKTILAGFLTQMFDDSVLANAFTEATFVTKIDRIKAPVSTNGYSIYLPYNDCQSYIYDNGGDMVETSTLISRNTAPELILYSSESGAVDSGIATDLFGLALTGFIIFALAVVCVKRKNHSKK